MPFEIEMGPPARVVGALFLLGSLVFSSVGAGAAGTAGEGPLAGGPSYRIVVNLPSRTLTLYRGDELVRRYRVAIGRPETPSPLGSYRVSVKVVNPTWYPKGRPPVPPGPANPVGTRWLGLNVPGLGIHGTNDPSSIGRAVSGGCIRLLNADVEELFSLVPAGTPVEFTYDTVELVPLAQGDLSSLAEEEAALPYAYGLAIHPDVYRHGANTVSRVRQVLLQAGITAALDEARLAQQVEEATGQLKPLPVEPRVVVAGRPAKRARWWAGQVWLPLSEAAELLGKPLFAWDRASRQVEGEVWVTAGDLAGRYGYRVKVVPATAALYLYIPLVFLEGRPIARAFGGTEGPLVPAAALAEACGREVEVDGCLGVAVGETNRVAPVRWRGEEACLTPEDAASLFALQVSIDAEGVWFAAGP